MNLPKDFREFLASLDANGVEYVVVGGVALAYHGYPRFTGDLDVLVAPGGGNVRRLLAALEAFGFGSLKLTEDDFAKSDTVIQLGFPPLRIDLMTSIAGVETGDAIARRVDEADGDLTVHFISREDLIRNKRATGRPEDIIDLEHL